ncbi:MAG TPA: hypothetical protein VFA59_19260 [Vicinamibacterales bacterium]|nr:hypothetical protein [Vicinamibacterales bacterium]
MRLVLLAAVVASLVTADPPAYTALGSGHLLREVSTDGRWLTLEDKSRWDVHPRDRFQTVDWERDASIAVRTTRGDDGFDYEIVNTSADEGVLAKFTPTR